MSLLSRILGKKSMPLSGAGYNLPISGGTIPSNWPWNFWQQGRDPIYYGENSTVHACIDAYAQTIAALHGHHMRLSLQDDGKKIQRGTPLSSFLNKPNSYQTRSDFMLNLIKTLLYDGNAYAFGVRDSQDNIVATHLLNPKTTRPMIERESREIFYAVGAYDLTEGVNEDGMFDGLIHSRDIMHLRLYTPRHPLRGVSPIANLTASIAANQSITAHQANFFSNMSRPSGIIYTDQVMTKDQMTMLREAWENQATGMNSGRIPILSNGLKWQQLSITSQDSELVEAFRMGVEEIARAYRVPLPLIGENRNATYSNVEQLVQSWMAMGLGFVLEHLELSIKAFFELPELDSCDFDVDTLLRTDFKGRLDALTKGVTGGIYSPNEARKKEGLPKVEYGDEPRVQAQVVPLSQVGMTPSADTPPSAPIDPDDEEEEEEEDVEEERAAYRDAIKRLSA